MPNETFYPEFGEFVALYRGIDCLWIADGTEEKPGNEGYLYAKYVNGSVKEMGPIFDYDLAKQLYEAEGGDLSYEDWISFLLNAPRFAVETEAAKNRTQQIKEETQQIKEETIEDTLEIQQQIDDRLDIVCNEMTATIRYQNSESGTVIPADDDGWEEDPRPSDPGTFMWTRVVLSWPGLSELTLYFVTGYKDPLASVEDIEHLFS